MQLEHLAYCDKVAIDKIQPVSGARKWKSVWNDRTVSKAVSLLENGEITLAHFLHRTSYAVMAGIKQGLRLRRQDDAESEDSDSEDGDESSGDDESSDESGED